jgi:molecular chaperone DnaK (HSP70)
MLMPGVTACGLDFGTSNTALAVYSGGAVVTHTEPSLLYFPPPL